MIAIVDSGIGNLGAILNMVKRLSPNAEILTEPRQLAQATRILLPGVGAFDAGMKNLKTRGFIEPLREAVQSRRVPLLGICLGMQLLTRSSEEGTEPGLGWLDARVVKFDRARLQSQNRVPHMGWNTIEIRKKSSLLEKLPEKSRFYFTHSFHVECAPSAQDLVLATTMHGYEFPSVIGQGNILGVQFHPEKSHRFGKLLLQSFLSSVGG